MHQQQEQKEEDEDASQLLRRLSSPIYHTGPLDNDNDDADDDTDNHHHERVFFLDETQDEAAEKVQRWWRGMQRTARRTGAVISARASLETIEKLLAEVVDLDVFQTDMFLIGVGDVVVMLLKLLSYVIG